MTRRATVTPAATLAAHIARGPVHPRPGPPAVRSTRSPVHPWAEDRVCMIAREVHKRDPVWAVYRWAGTVRLPSTCSSFGRRLRLALVAAPRAEPEADTATRRVRHPILGRGGQVANAAGRADGVDMTCEIAPARCRPGRTLALPPRPRPGDATAAPAASPKPFTLSPGNR